VKRRGKKGDCIATLSEIRIRFDVLMKPVKLTVVKFTEAKKNECQVASSPAFPIR
jgi:hypothetical protein